MNRSFRIFAPASLMLLSLSVPGHADDAVPFGDFTECEDTGAHPSLSGTLCTNTKVPLDYAEAAKGTIELFVRKFPAQENPRGQLWLVAGGPGESGASFYPFIETIREAAPGFDLMIPDHRGTGFSTRLCPDEESPSSTGGSALAGQEWGTCFGSLNANLERTKSFTISNAAHDLGVLMSRFDTRNQKYIYGVSYGTQLVLRMLAIVSPDDIDGVILDSIVPHEKNLQFDLSHRSEVTDSVGRQVLRDCDESADCSKYFPEGAQEAVRQILERDDIEKMLGSKPKFQLATLLDFPKTREILPNVIAGLQAGDPAWFQYAMQRLTTIVSVFEPYPQAVASIPLVSLISRSENSARPDMAVETVEREEQDYLFASPLPSLLLAGGIPTYEPDESYGVSPATIPRTIVLHGTLDPKTPYSGAQEHVGVLEAAGSIVLLPIKGAPHYILMTAPDEFKKAVHSFIEFDTRTTRPNEN